MEVASQQKKNRESVLLSAQKARNQTLSGSVFTIILVTILIFGAIRPTIITINRIISGNKRKAEVEAQLDNKIKAIEELTREYNNDVREEIELLSYLYPAKGNFSLVMANIDKVCEQNGFYMSSINFSRPSRDVLEDSNLVIDRAELLVPWQADIVVVGDKQRFVNLLIEIEKMPIYPTITAVRYGRDTDDQGRTSFSVSMLLYKVDNINLYE